MGTIITRKQGNNTYYLYQETYREKINKKDYGKNRGSGKSKVHTRSIYLGAAETILKCIKGNRSPVKVNTRNFGMIAAAFQAAYLMIMHFIQVVLFSVNEKGKNLILNV